MKFITSLSMTLGKYVQGFTIRVGVLACMLCACSVSSFAEEYSNTNIQLFYTANSKVDPISGSGTSDEKLTSFKFEHFGTFKYGDHYFMLDNYHGIAVGGAGAGSFGGDASNQQFTTWMPRLSLGKLSGQKLQFGPVSDISLAARVEYASYGNFQGYGIGPSFDLVIPGFDFVTVRLLWRNTNYNSSSLYLHTAWGTAFDLGGRKAHFDGYFFTTGTDSNGRDLFAEPEFTIDIDPKGSLQGGLRLTHHSYTLGGASYTRDTPQLLLKWNL